MQKQQPLQLVPAEQELMAQDHELVLVLEEQEVITVQDMEVMPVQKQPLLELGVQEVMEDDVALGQEQEQQQLV